jgi:hypothetical protein
MHWIRIVSYRLPEFPFELIMMRLFHPRKHNGKGVPLTDFIIIMTTPYLRLLYALRHEHAFLTLAASRD